MKLKRTIIIFGLMGLLFVVGCNKTQPTQPAPQQSPQTSQTPPATNPPAATQVSGSDLYNSNCLSCHGANGAGSNGGPKINTSEFRNNSAKVQDIVKNGKESMPGYADSLNATQIKAIGDYVASLK